MIITKMRLSRREVLRGLGTTLALPLLDAMMPALSAAAKPPTRFMACYVAQGAHMAQWTPTSEGSAFEITPCLEPLAAYRDQMVVLSGLSNERAAPTPGDSGGPHSRIQAAFLTGSRARKTEGADFQVGMSVDQIIARQICQDTQFTSLELGLESVDLVVGGCDYGYTCAYTSTLAWKTPTTPLPNETNPRVLFERLFGDGGSTDASVRLARQREDRSVLDSVNTEMARLARSLGSSDKLRVNEYFEAVRDIERRIELAERQSGRELPVFSQPAGIPPTYAEHARLMFDLLALAWQADLTRVSTYVLARELSSRTYPEIGVPEAHHPLSHHGDDPAKLAKIAKLNAYHASLFAHFVEKLRTTPDGDGTMLDHSLLLYGSGMSNSNQHLHRNLPLVLLGGSGGTVKGGMHYKYDPTTPMANLHLTLLDKFGVPTTSFGDSTGTLSL
ncbi:MAG TPA: DUF1552 domain-containing protein [Vicinamibacterales bacterium]